VAARVSPIVRGGPLLYVQAMPIVPCIPEDPADPPFELFVEPLTAIGVKIRDGEYLVIGRKLWETEKGEIHIESLMVRKVT
jgi:hypothetical protein